MLKVIMRDVNIYLLLCRVSLCLSVVMLNVVVPTEEACSDKRSSLFDLFVSGEEKSFATWSTFFLCNLLMFKIS
jgi:hypothetical protein